MSLYGARRIGSIEVVAFGCSPNVQDTCDFCKTRILPFDTPFWHKDFAQCTMLSCWQSIIRTGFVL